MKEDYTVEWDRMNLPGFGTDQMPMDSVRTLFLTRRLQDGRISINLLSATDLRPLVDQELALWSRPDRPAGLWVEQESGCTVARCNEDALQDVCRWIVETYRDQQ